MGLNESCGDREHDLQPGVEPRLSVPVGSAIQEDPMTQHDTAATPEEQRALSRDELEMADQTRHPALGDLSDRDFSDLVSRLRERRNRARDLGGR